MGRAGAATAIVPGQDVAGGCAVPGRRSCCGGWDLPASLLFAVLTSVAVTTALASFGARALPAAVHHQLASAPGTSVQISGQIGAARASADTPVIRSSLRSALGTVPFTLVSGRWSDQLALPQRHRGATIPLIQAAVLGGVTAQTELTAGAGPDRGGGRGLCGPSKVWPTCPPSPWSARSSAWSWGPPPRS